MLIDPKRLLLFKHRHVSRQVSDLVSRGEMIQEVAAVPFSLEKKATQLLPGVGADLSSQTCLGGDTQLL